MVTSIVYYIIAAFAVMTVIASFQQVLRAVREFRQAITESETDAPVLG
ncbi:MULTISPECIES: hypothetical protein [unclassified Rothia (in: high G+C Gram-positive bacteria)]|nr:MULTISPECIES: hypothetical protein [unclassified Rothia (in: high G+C Gram-positive bacteria)]MBM7052205.1 hypothetical protein [Rothia sp. ZJ1223]QRZ61355.1 hypothetical protein JR346_09010 [Rothia sp. ZJ932]